MKKVELSTWYRCAETGIKLAKGVIAYQDLTTKKVYASFSTTVQKWLVENEMHIPYNEHAPYEHVPR